MGLFSKERKLVDYDPKELDLDMLSHLQASLVAKLILVNEELISRWVSVATLGSDIPNTEGAQATLQSGAAHLKEFNTMLEEELARIVGNTEGHIPKT